MSGLPDPSNQPPTKQEDAHCSHDSLAGQQPDPAGADDASQALAQTRSRAVAHRPSRGKHSPRAVPRPRCPQRDVPIDGVHRSRRAARWRRLWRAVLLESLPQRGAGRVADRVVALGRRADAVLHQRLQRDHRCPSALGGHGEDSHHFAQIALSPDCGMRMPPSGRRRRRRVASPAPSSGRRPDHEMSAVRLYRRTTPRITRVHSKFSDGTARSAPAGWSSGEPGRGDQRPETITRPGSAPALGAALACYCVIG